MAEMEGQEPIKKAERDTLAAKLKDAEHDRDEFRRVMNGFAEKMAELEGQEPVAWVEVVSTHEGPYNFEGMALLGKGNHLLYARPVPAEMSPDFTDTARAALLWVLWHHQGGSSPVGQPIRYALGMDAHEHLSKHQVQEAKRWAALTKSESNDFRQARTAPPEPVNARLLEAVKKMIAAEEACKSSSAWVQKRLTGEEHNLRISAWQELHSAIAAAEAQQESPVPMVVSWPWLRGVISAIPTRVEKSGGQNHRYVALDEVLGWLEEGQRRADEAQQAEPVSDALQDMYDAGREIERVMAEAAPKAARLTMGECMQAVKHLSFDEMTLFGIAHAIETAFATKNGIEVAE